MGAAIYARDLMMDERLQLKGWRPLARVEFIDGRWRYADMTARWLEERRNA